MKKIYITIASVWAFSAMNAQILTNGDTNATLFKTNYFLDASNFQGQSDASQGKLLGFPKTDLTKFKFNLGVVTDEVTLSGFDGVIVYNTVSGTVGEHADGGYTANTMGEQVTVEPGFYYFSNPNGADNQSVTDGKWIRLSDAQVNEQLWAQRQANGVTETYLKPALANNDFVGYKNNSNFEISLGKGNPSTAPYSLILSSKVLPLTSTLPHSSPQYIFSYTDASINEDHVANSEQGNGRWYKNQINLNVDDVTSSIRGVEGLAIESKHRSNSEVGSIRAFAGITVVGTEDGSVNPLVTKDATGVVGHVRALKNSTIENMTAFRTIIVNKSQNGVKNIRGIDNVMDSYVKEGVDASPAHTIETMRGIDNKVTVSPNATVENTVSGITSNVRISENTTLQDHIYGKYSNLSLGENITMAADKRVYGDINDVRVASALPQNDIFIGRNAFRLMDGATVKDVSLSQSVIYSKGTTPATVRNMFAFNFWNAKDNNWTADRMYGIYLDDIRNGQIANYGLYMENVGNGTATDNYSIYTKAGKLRFGDLANASATTDRVVTVDNEGVLKTQDATAFANANSEWVYDADNNQVKLKKSGSGDFANKVYYTADGGYKNIDGNGQSLPSFNSFTQSETTDSNSNITRNQTFVLGSTINIPASVTNNDWGDLGVTANSYSTYMDDVPDRATYYNNFGVGIYAPEALTSFKNLRSLTGFSSGATTASSAWLREIIGNSVRTQITPTGLVTLAKGQDVTLAVYSNQTMDKAEGVANALRIYSESGTVKRAIGNNTILTFQRQSGATVNNMIGNNVVFASWESSNPIIQKAVGINFQGFTNGLTEINSTQPTITDFVGLQIADVSGATHSNYAIYTNKGENSFGDKVVVRKSGDGAELLKFATDRPWVFKQVGVEDNAGLVLQSEVDNKAFRVINRNGEPIATFRAGEDMIGNKVGIGVSIPNEKLEVAGNVKADRFIATATGSVFPDYVFEKYYNGESKLNANYDFKTLDQVESFVKANGHLPGYISAKEIKEAGQLDMTATQLTNVEKIEELYLHLIEKEKEVQSLKTELNAQKKDMQELKSLVQQLLNK